MGDPQQADLWARAAIRQYKLGYWHIGYDRCGTPMSIRRGDMTVVHLEGSQRTAACAEPLVAYLNSLEDWMVHNTSTGGCDARRN